MPRKVPQAGARFIANTRTKSPRSNQSTRKKSRAPIPRPLLPTLRDALPGYTEFRAADDRVIAVRRDHNVELPNHGGSNGRTENFRSTGNRR